MGFQNKVRHNFAREGRVSPGRAFEGLGQACVATSPGPKSRPIAETELERIKFIQNSK